METEHPRHSSSNSDYSLLRNPSSANNSVILDRHSLVFVRTEDIESIPGFWIYEQYTVSNLKKLRILHSLGFVCEVLGYLIGTLIKNFSDELANPTPFSVNAYFVTAMWGVIIILAFAQTLSIFSKSLNMFTVLTDQLKSYQFPLYLILAVFLVTKCFYKNAVVGFFDVFILIVAGVFAVVIYYKVKYEDDGRFFVSRLEFLGVHVQYSVLTAWIFVEICVNTLAILDKWDQYSDKGKFMGWKTSYWTITIMTVTTALSIVMLYKLKDVFFTCTFSFAYFGVYTNHILRAKHHSIEDDVKTTSLIFGCLLIIFAAITVFFYPRIVFYMNRKRSITN